MAGIAEESVKSTDKAMREERYIKYIQPNGYTGFLALSAFAFFWVSDDKTWAILKTKLGDPLVITNIDDVATQLLALCADQWPDEINVPES